MWKIGAVIFKIFLLSLAILSFSESTRFAKSIGSIELPLGFSIFLTALSATVAVCIISIIMLIPSNIICFCLEKINKKEVGNKLCWNITILLSSLFFFYRLLTPEPLWLLFIILIIPLESINFKKIWSNYKGLIIIWAIAIVAIFFIIGVFKYLEKLDSPSSYSPHLIEYERSRKDYTIVNIVDEVYICTGTNAKTYHKDEYCRGLNNCSGEIECISHDEAEDLGRRKCRICIN